MKFRPLRRFVIDDYPEADSWFRDFLDALNPLVDTLNPLLQNNISLNDNILGERQIVSVQHGVPVTVRLNVLTAQPNFVRVGYAGGYVGVGAVTTYNGNRTVTITIYFLGTPPAGSVLATIYLEP